MKHSSECPGRFEKIMMEDFALSERLVSRDLRMEERKLEEEADIGSQNVELPPHDRGRSSQDPAQAHTPPTRRARPQEDTRVGEEDSKANRRRLCNLVCRLKKKSSTITAYDRFEAEAAADIMVNVIESIEQKYSIKCPMSKVNRLMSMMMDVQYRGASPDESEEKMAELHEDLDFLDDVNELEPSERSEVIKAQMQEM